jgi:hypothetical protein
VQSAPIPASRLVTVNGVQWHNVLDFTHMFRGFRLAMNPAKLLMAILAILLIYAAGRLFDACWGPQVYPNEMTAFQNRSAEEFRTWRNNQVSVQKSNLDDLLDRAASFDSTLTYDRRQELREHPTAAFGALKAAYHLRFSNEVEVLQKNRGDAEKIVTDLHSGKLDQTPAEIEQAGRKASSERLFDSVQKAHAAAGSGIFDTFLMFELDEFDKLVENTLAFVRIAPIHTNSRSLAESLDAGSALSGGLLSKDPDRIWRSDTVAGCIANMVVTGPSWLFTGAGPMTYRPENADTWGGWIKMVLYRLVYLASLTVLVIFSLVVLAFTGASIARLSAVELAGMERPLLIDIFRFAGRRLWSFIRAPIAPFLILLGVGLTLTIGGLIGAIPFIGPILLGILFFVTIAVCFVLMLLLLGIIGGFNLLYPTIAVEGADSFDAMSRSFAYVYARPWRLIFYTIISLVYGVITFIFVSFVAYLILMLAHTFTGWGLNVFGYHYGVYSGVSKMETIWPEPRFMHLVNPINWYAMSWSEYFGAIILHFWVFLLISGIGAYVISYYFSSHTIMYLLLRRAVDGQSIREVYVETAAPVVQAAVAQGDVPVAPAAGPSGEVGGQGTAGS